MKSFTFGWELYAKVQF